MTALLGISVWAMALLLFHNVPQKASEPLLVQRSTVKCDSYLRMMVVLVPFCWLKASKGRRSLFWLTVTEAESSMARQVWPQGAGAREITSLPQGAGAREIILPTMGRKQREGTGSGQSY